MPFYRCNSLAFMQFLCLTWYTCTPSMHIFFFLFAGGRTIKIILGISPRSQRLCLMPSSRRGSRRSRRRAWGWRPASRWWSWSWRRDRGSTDRSGSALRSALSCYWFVPGSREKPAWSSSDALCFCLYSSWIFSSESGLTWHFYSAIPFNLDTFFQNQLGLTSCSSGMPPSQRIVYYLKTCLRQWERVCEKLNWFFQCLFFVKASLKSTS